MIEVGSLPSGNPIVSCGVPLPKLVKEFLYTYNLLLTTEYVNTSLPKIMDFCSPVIWIWLLILAIFALATEWFVRKYNGLL